MALKLHQSQIWKLGNSYLRIIKLERLSVDYKDMPAPRTHLGTHHTLTKKEFCRLIKDATEVGEDGVPVNPPKASPVQPSRPAPTGLPSSMGSRRLPMASRGKPPAKGDR